MATNGNAEPIVVKAKFAFKGKNNDELCFKKNEMITVTQKLDEGGWWEGTLNGKTGWFPADFVTELDLASNLLNSPTARAKSPSVGQRHGEFVIPQPEQKAQLRQMVLKDLINSEKVHLAELQTLISTYLNSMFESGVISETELLQLACNLAEIISCQSSLLKMLETNVRTPSMEQKIGSEFLHRAPTFKLLFRVYCRNHPTAALLVSTRRDSLAEHMNSIGSNLMALVQGLSKPFRRLEKYPIFLQEIERNMEDNHPDRGDTQRAASVFRDLADYCSDIRKQKEFLMELLSIDIKGWAGESLKQRGELEYTGNVAVCTSDQTTPEDCCLLLFANSLVVLNVSRSLTGYVFKYDIPLNGVYVKRQNASPHGQQVLELYGGALETRPFLLVFSSNSDLNRWLEAIQNVGVQSDVVCNMISPSSPSKYDTVQGNLNPAMKAEISTLPSPGQAQLKKSSTLPVAAMPTLALSEKPFVGHPYQPKLWSTFSLRPNVGHPQRPNVKLRRKDDRNYVDDVEDTQVLRVVEAYCSTSVLRPPVRTTSNTEVPHVLVAEDEKILIEEIIGDDVVIQEKTLVDTVYVLKEQIDNMKDELRDMQKQLEKEQKARKRLEEIVRKTSVTKKHSSGEVP